MIKGFNVYKDKFNINTKEEINLGLDRIQGFLAEIGHPQKEIKAIHIAGTNGKGSTLQYLRRILMEAGYKTGTFTSPHILNVNDQICTNEGPISVHEFEATIEYLLSIVDEKNKIQNLTDFELLTCLAIVYFSRINKQDVVIFEAGMGGLTDSTNVIHPLLSIITSISLEHTDFLGSSIEEIAYQKAGIIKENSPSITGVRNSTALRVIKEASDKHHSNCYVLNEHFFITEKEDNFEVHTKKKDYTQLQIAMKGRHQRENCSLAIMAAEVLQAEKLFKIEEKHIKQGIFKAFIPGRFEVISESPRVILDGAHNPAAVIQLVNILKEEYSNYKLTFIFGAVKDKDTLSMISMLEPIAEKMIFVDFEFPRAASAAYLEKQCSLDNKKSSNDLRNTFQSEINNLEKNEALVITGSLYLLAEVKPIIDKYLKNTTISM